MKKTLEQIETAMVILECKDHWTAKDWAEWQELEDERRSFYPEPKEPTEEEVDQRIIEKNESLGAKFMGYDENGAMIFKSTWKVAPPERRKNIKKGHYNFF